MNRDTTFTVTDEHLKLLRRMYVRWEDCEYGAPSIDCKRPYGNSSVVIDIAEIIHGRKIEWLEDREGFIAGDRVFRQDEIDRLEKLHLETETALQIALATGAFRAGRYQRSDYSTDWRLLELTPSEPAA